MTEPQHARNQNNPTNWVELREYVEARMADMQRHYDYRLDSIESVRQHSADDLERRLMLLDEAQRTKYPTREDMRHITDAYAADIRLLRENAATQQGKASIASFYLTLVIAIAGLTLGLFEVFTH